MECHNRKQKTEDRSQRSVLCRLSSVVCPLSVAIVAILGSVCLSQQAAVPQQPAAVPASSDASRGGGSVRDANVPGGPGTFPYLAEITGDDVFVRSGAGTNFYACGRLYRGDKVKVVGSQSGWSKIVPPTGSYSWISVRCVGLNLNNPTDGLVTGDGVYVYAGSDDVLPMHSTSEQVSLKRGDKVRLLGEQKDDYYKIAPPTGACLWVSTQYTRPIAPAETAVAPTPEGPGQAPPAPTGPTEGSVEAEKLKEYYALKEKVQAEQAKPMAQQNYADLKKALIEIANNKQAGKAARYAEFTINQIERYELALSVAKEVQQQTEQLQQAKDQIDKTRAAKLSEIKDLGRFAVIGEFQSSLIYGADPGAPGRRYRIVDKSGKIICYAMPAGEVAQKDLSKFVGQKVGLVGTIEPHAPTAGALVKFTEIVELK